MGKCALPWGRCLTGKNEQSKNYVELVERIKEGDRDAEAQLVAQFGDAIGIIIRKRARSQDDAQDIYQTVFTLVISKLRKGELKNPEGLPAWLCTIARTQATMFYRSDRLTQEFKEDQMDESNSKPPTPYDEIVKQEHLDAVRQILQELKHPRDREVLDRFYLQEQSKDQVCEEMGMNRDQLNRVLSRARERFKKLASGRIVPFKKKD